MKKFFLIFLVLILGSGVQLYTDNNILDVSYYTFSSNKLPDSFDEVKILQLSDLHSKLFGEDNQVLLNKIDEINPDIIMMTGDMITDDGSGTEVFLNLAQNIAAKYETYFIFGNHELAMSDVELTKLVDKLTSYGIATLNNEKIKLTRNGQTINLYGMWYNLKYYFNDEFTKEKMDQIVGEDNDDNLDLLLTHDPKNFEVYSKWGAELVLSGHVHGGMVRIPFVGALFSPDRTLFPKYSAGIYIDNDAMMVVSRGLGKGLNGFRVLNKPELVVITLKNG